MIKTISWILACVILVCLLLQVFSFGGLNKDFFAGIIPNLLTEIIGIAFTLYIVDTLIKASKQKEKLKEENILMKEIIGNQFNQFVIRMTKQYTHFITKEPPGLELNVDSLQNVIDSLNEYIKDNFVKKPVKQIIVGKNANDIFAMETVMTDYQEFCEFHLKGEINDQITMFLGRFITVIPNEVRVTIFKISDILRGNIFITPLQHGLRMDISHAQINVSDFITEYKQLGEEIKKLYKYVEV